MCGIVGYIGKNRAVPYLLEGLEKLEYRGYDSAGIATVEDGALRILKTKGRVSSLDVNLQLHELLHVALEVSLVPEARQPSASDTPVGPPTADRTTSTPTRTRAGAACSALSTTA